MKFKLKLLLIRFISLIRLYFFNELDLNTANLCNHSIGFQELSKNHNNWHVYVRFRLSKGAANAQSDLTNLQYSLSTHDYS